MERIELLRSWIKTEPLEPFNYYCLALEYQKQGDAQAGMLFEKLLLDFPKYLPTYYTAAKYYEELEPSKAKLVYEQGILLAEALNNGKALKELKTAYQNFIFEQD